MAEYIKDTIPASAIHIDTDSDYGAMPLGGSPYIINVDIQEGNLNVRSRALGNAVQTKTLPAGTNVIIGQCEDVENNAVIYFVANSNNNDCIIRYNYDESFTNISYSENWGFSSSYKINKAGIIGTGNDAQLWWTDNNSEVRKVNIYHEINTYSGNDYGNSYLMKPAPTAPTFTFLDDTDRDTNNIQNHIFHFCAQFVFDTGEASHWGHISKLAFDYESDIFSYYNFIDPQYSNGIRLTITIGYANISKVRVAFREVDVGSSATSDWFLAGEVDYSAGSVTFDFYNDIRYPLDQTEFEPLYYDVPRLARTGTSSKDNRIVFADVTKDRDLTTLDVTFELVSKAASLGEYAAIYQSDDVSFGFPATFENFGYSASEERFIKIYIKGIVTTGANADLWTLYGDKEEYVLTSDYYSSSVNDSIDFFVDKINAETSYNITASRVSDDLRITKNVADDNDVVVTALYGANNTKYLTLPAGSVAYFAVCYYDQFGRADRANISSDTILNIPLASNYLKVNKLKYTIDTIPPSWATHYRILFGGTNIFKTFTVPMVVAADVHFNEVDWYKDGDYIKIKYSQILDRIYDDKNDANIETFEVGVGDYVRIVGYINYPFYVNYIYHTTCSSELANPGEFKILDIIEFGDELNEKEIVISNWDFHTSADYFNGEQSGVDVVLVQFVAYKKNIDPKNLEYQEVGGLLPITSGAHTATAEDGFGVTAQNQIVSDGVSTQPAIGVLDFGNLFFTFFNFFNEVTLNNDFDNVGCIAQFMTYLESENASFSYASKYNQYGNINLYEPEFKERTFKSIMWGGTYSEDGVRFNELNKFISTNIKHLDDKHGGVYGLEEEGQTLNVLQKSKLTTFGVGVDYIATSDEGEQLVTIGGVLGEPRPFIENLGTVFPFSVVRNNRYIYYYDIYAGKIMRKAPNGQEPISDYGLSYEMKSLSNNLLGLGIANVDVVAGWDGVNKMYIITFIDNNDGTYSKTFAFHEPSNQWITQYSFIADLYAKIGENVFLSFKSGVLYKHHDTSVNAAYFYGASYDSYVWLVFNKYPDLTKTFLSIIEDSSYVWGMPGETAILIASDALEYTDTLWNYDRHKADMTSRLLAAQFRYRNGEFRAEFMRDAKTTSTTFKQYDLINGRVLKGKNILCKLNNGSTDDVQLRNVTVVSVPTL